MAYDLSSSFYCCKCGSKGLPVVRLKGKGRPAGHLKKLFCLKCQMETNHAECKENSKYTYEDFLFEFENNNFDETQKRILEYGQFRDKMHKEGLL